MLKIIRLFDKLVDKKNDNNDKIIEFNINKNADRSNKKWKKNCLMINYFLRKLFFLNLI